MKFNVLVVAAMVITSVNAGGRKGFPGWFKKGGKLKSVLTRGLPRKELSLPQTPKVMPTEEKPANDLYHSYYDSDDPDDPDDPDDLDDLDDSGGENAKPNPVCDPLISGSLQFKKDIIELVHEFENQMKDLKALDDVVDDLSPDELKDYSVLRSKVRTELENIEDEYTDLMEKYHGYLQGLAINKCWTKSLHLKLPKDLMTLDALLSEDLKLLKYKTDDKSVVDALDKQKDDKSDLGALDGK
ncbi:hypothetical protein BASA50_007424 [Batrachochytrium salamandrivorans]|uniref:Uncharacterized protein n=1 Tax=Batrachochytrium salamandrivorans TaxID=1357716 RepID=A0ABQ8F9Z6_9FUNG|nr:hypothetical protein BASA60_000191 [Batrachochytrium salamandrivorans]KAH6562781.1 hypothetical protein BASA62_008936 [Batrachochytrium salamandrivorans]KAH6584662.1 hypothetical protein BASA61_007307 [Batrachochytrium salamandrivorans]KAH6593217.1 hypothetical protein BASA50_007424 [Batrachochytrium salamandrivorans]KAH9274120.1 hypothetical protein BASA83_003422 [Batrachochytrium salamandrivorans]